MGTGKATESTSMPRGKREELRQSFACVHAKSLQLCRTGALQATLSMGILQARVLEWVAMLSSRGSSQPRDQTRIS